jgi:DNA-binding beta-propeller fold protein YncE
MSNWERSFASRVRAFFIGGLLSGGFVAAQTPSRALLILEKSDQMMAMADPATLKIVARVPAGPDPHEIVASPDGKLAYISNYGGSDGALNTISVVDLVAQKALPTINLGALHSTHGLDFAGGKLYFTAETNKVVGRYDPATQTVDWVLGTGQDGTHMVWVNESLDRLVTSNVSSGTISIIEQISPASGAQGPPSGGRKTWKVSNVWAGRGAEGFDVSPDGKEIWAANAQDATATIIDIAGKRSVQTVAIPVQGANRLKFTLDGKRVLVSGLGGSWRADAVLLDAVTHKEVKQFDLGGGSAGILMTPDGSRAFVAVSAKDKVAVIDLKTLEITGYIATGKNPDGLAWAEQK